MNAPALIPRSPSIRISLGIPATIPYWNQAKFRMSGIGVIPWGAGAIDRGIGWSNG